MKEKKKKKKEDCYILQYEITYIVCDIVFICTKPWSYGDPIQHSWNFDITNLQLYVPKYLFFFDLIKYTKVTSKRELKRSDTKMYKLVCLISCPPISRSSSLPSFTCLFLSFDEGSFFWKEKGGKKLINLQG